MENKKNKKNSLPLYVLYHSVVFEPLKCIVICLSYMLAMHAGEVYRNPWNVFVFHLVQRRVWNDEVAYEPGSLIPPAFFEAYAVSKSNRQNGIINLAVTATSLKQINSINVFFFLY